MDTTQEAVRERMVTLLLTTRSDAEMSPAAAIHMAAQMTAFILDPAKVGAAPDIVQGRRNQ